MTKEEFNARIKELIKHNDRENVMKFIMSSTQCSTTRAKFYTTEMFERRIYVNFDPFEELENIHTEGVKRYIAPKRYNVVDFTFTHR